MKQYWELKAQAPDCLLLFRMGDFYELFGPDAVEAAQILEITLTSRDKNKANPLPMAGVPFHSIQGYLQKLLNAGKKVAVSEQMEDPTVKVGKSIVRRQIVRILTPGVQFDQEGADANYLGALVPSESVSGKWRLALIDASTGESLISGDLSLEDAEAEVFGRPVRHLLCLGVPKLNRASSEVLIEDLSENYLSISQAKATLQKHFEVESLAAFFDSDSATRALGLALTYVLRTQQQDRMAHLRIPQPLHRPQALLLGPRTAQHLDLLPNLDGTPSLFQLINRTKSALGARQLKRWLIWPLKNLEEIKKRQQLIREWSEGSKNLGAQISGELSKIYDLERILGRVNHGLANPRDTLALGKSISSLVNITALLGQSRAECLEKSQAVSRNLAAKITELGSEITRMQLDDAPLVARDGGIFARGTDPELDRLLSLTENGQIWLLELEAKERETTSIPSLKIRYNRVFGYYIEVTQAHLKNVPAHYQRKQTTVGAERFFTEELKKFEDEFVHASSRQKALEQELFRTLLEKIKTYTAPLMEAAQFLGALDSLISLSHLAHEPAWNFPVVDDSMEVVIKAGRHPMVDLRSNGAFVPNDLSLTAQGARSLVITGPNMGGKSTVMRQTALIIILGQMGAPVPAESASWGFVSSLYTRIGANDAISRGQSTFMVEMSELAHILHHADARSFIVLDEIGRGTSTYDGISVAWATLEWICASVQARTLFATHYHELTKLTESIPHLANAHMAVESSKQGKASSLRFLYELKAGPANESFGIHVARIAGLPKPVIERAWKVLEHLEKEVGSESGASPDQLSLFQLAASESEPDEKAMPAVEPPESTQRLIEELHKTDINEMTPVQALNFVLKLQEISREPSAKSASAPNP